MSQDDFTSLGKGIANILHKQTDGAVDSITNPTIVSMKNATPWVMLSSVLRNIMFILFTMSTAYFLYDLDLSVFGNVAIYSIATLLYFVLIYRQHQHVGLLTSLTAKNSMGMAIVASIFTTLILWNVLSKFGLFSNGDLAYFFESLIFILVGIGILEAIFLKLTKLKIFKYTFYWFSHLVCLIIFVYAIGAIQYGPIAFVAKFSKSSIIYLPSSDNLIKGKIKSYRSKAEALVKKSSGTNFVFKASNNYYNINYKSLGKYTSFFHGNNSKGIVSSPLCYISAESDSINNVMTDYGVKISGNKLESMKSGYFNTLETACESAYKIFVTTWERSTQKNRIAQTKQSDIIRCNRITGEVYRFDYKGKTTKVHRDDIFNIIKFEFIDINSRKAMVIDKKNGNQFKCKRESTGLVIGGSSLYG